MSNQKPGRCPECGGELSAVELGKPWCTACEWNLAGYDPAVLPPRGWLWLERWGHGSAGRHDARLLAEYSGTPPDRSKLSAAQVVLVGISAVLALVAVGCVVLGVSLTLHDFPSGWVLPGLGLILLGYTLRPRVGRGPRQKHRLRRDQAPVFFALLDQVASTTGAAGPESVVLAAEYNASTARYGLRGRHSLSIGIPLWLVLSPPMRVALLAHELGHLVNRDPSRGLLVEPALNTFRRFAEATGAERTLGYVFSPERNHRLAQLVFELLLWAVSRVFLLVHLGLLALGLRDHQRAEIRADAIAARTAGTDALTALLDRLILSERTVRLISDTSVRVPPTGWSGLADVLHDKERAALPEYRQFTRRTTSLWSTHPPLGVRTRLVESWPREEPVVVLSDGQWDEIDRELKPWYTAAHRAVLGSRDYHRQEPLAG